MHPYNSSVDLSPYNDPLSLERQLNTRDIEGAFPKKFKLKSRRHIDYSTMWKETTSQLVQNPPKKYQVVNDYNGRYSLANEIKKYAQSRTQNRDQPKKLGSSGSEDISNLFIQSVGVRSKSVNSEFRAINPSYHK